LKARHKLKQQTLTMCLNAEQQAHWLQTQQEPISLCHVVNVDQPAPLHDRT